MLRRFYFVGEEVKRSIEWLIKRGTKWRGCQSPTTHGDGLSMWHRRFYWPITIGLCLVKEHPQEFTVDSEPCGEACSRTGESHLIRRPCGSFESAEVYGEPCGGLFGLRGTIPRS